MQMAASADSERNKAVIRQLPGLLQTLDPSAIRALFTQDFQLHESKRPDWPHGHEGAIRLFVFVKSMMPDMTISIEDMFGEADKVCVRWRFKGTLTGTRSGVVLSATAISRVR
jgi:predicted ester cyclase